VFKATEEQGTLLKTLVNDYLLTWLEAFMIDRKAQGVSKGTLYFYEVKFKSLIYVRLTTRFSGGGQARDSGREKTALSHVRCKLLLGKSIIWLLLKNESVPFFSYRITDYLLFLVNLLPNYSEISVSKPVPLC